MVINIRTQQTDDAKQCKAESSFTKCGFSPLIRQYFNSFCYMTDTLCLFQDLWWQIVTTSAVIRSNSILSSVTLSVAVSCCSASFPASSTPHTHPHPTSSLPWLRLAGWQHYQFLLSACLQKIAYVTVITGSIKARVMQIHWCSQPSS